MPCSPSCLCDSLLHRQAFDQFLILAFEQFMDSDETYTPHSYRAHQPARPHPVGVSAVTKLPSYVTSWMMLHRIQVYTVSELP